MILGLSLDFLLHPPDLLCKNNLDDEEWYSCSTVIGCKTAAIAALDRESPFTFDNWQTQFGLYCKSHLMLGFLGCTNFVGMALGCYIIGHVIDLWGRKKILIVGMIGILGAILWMRSVSALAELYIAFFLYGFFSGVRTISGYALSLELVPSQHRKKIAVINTFSVCLGILFSSLIFYYFKSSQVFLTILSIFIAAVLVFVCFLPESPEFLYTKFRFEEVREMLSKIAVFNQKEKIEN